MDTEAFKAFISAVDKKLKDADFSTDKRVLARAVKLSEEVGELCSAVLAHGNNQRKEKMDEYDPGNTAEEFADVIITTFLLAKAMDIDIEKGMEDKMAKIKERFNL